MKIAVCYSGQIREFDHWKTHKEYLPDADYYYSTWEDQRELVPDELKNSMKYYPNPPETYNCYQVESFQKIHGRDLDVRYTSEAKRKYTAYFQHLAHWNIVKDLKEGYDIVIRMRYDTILGCDKSEYLELCKRVEKYGVSIGVGNFSGACDNNKNKHREKPERWFPENPNKEKILDFMNIHKFTNFKNVQDLVDREEMWPTNAGWLQVLGQSGYENYHGGIQLSRKI
jgi:hypothetical protein